MESLHHQLVDLFIGLSPLLKNIFILGISFGEGLPIIGSFLPGGTIAILIGALSEEGLINPWLAIHLIAIGSLCGDLVGFFAGRKLLHISWVNKIVYSEKHIKSWDLFDRHTALVIVIGKLLPLVRSTPALFAGARKMNVFRYMLYVAIASYLWAIAGIFGGKYLSQLLGNALLPIIVGIVIVTIIISIFSRRKSKKKALGDKKELI
jgi:membrane protein DedA with SNARE-associated domain